MRLSLVSINEDIMDWISYIYFIQHTLNSVKNEAKMLEIYDP